MMTQLKKWELLAEADISPSKWFPLFRHKVRLPNGHIMDDYYVSRLGDVAMIVPVTEDKKLVFVQQYKHGIREITLEFPAGIVEAGQTPMQAAFAELEQETGIVTRELSVLGELRTLPSKNFAKLFGFLAEHVSITKKQELDVSEEIEVITLTEKEVEEKILNGIINCSDTVALFFLYQLRSRERQSLK